jgi:hypothetical protein
MQRALVGLMLTSALLLASTPGLATAEPSAYGASVDTAGSDDPLPFTAQAPGAHLHDGFYMRLASGFGVLDERLSSSAGATPTGEVKARNRGMATVGELSFGGTLGSGWVLGGGIYGADLIASTYKSRPGSADSPPAELDPELRSLAVIAPFFDYYPDPTRGFHFMAALGLATLTPRVFGDAATEQSEYLAIGGGLILGTGYDWWVADEWSLGVLARTSVAVLSGKDEAAARWVHIITGSPSLLVTLTYH